MSYKVIMFRSDNDNEYMFYNEYVTQIPMNVISQLALIEKRDWILFRDSPYHMFGEFIYRNLAHYPKLAAYINKNNYKFEFIYEYVSDHSELLHTTYYRHETPIDKDTYLVSTDHKDYLERWIMIDPGSCKALLFFECNFVYA